MPTPEASNEMQPQEPQVPAAGEPGSRENPNVVPLRGNEYGGYTGNRIPVLDPRIVGRPEQTAMLRAAAERVAGQPEQTAPQPK